MSCGKIPKNISVMSHGKRKQEALCEILSAYKNHPSIKHRQNFFGKKLFSLTLLPEWKLKNLLNVLI